MENGEIKQTALTGFFQFEAFNFSINIMEFYEIYSCFNTINSGPPPEFETTAFLSVLLKLRKMIGAYTFITFFVMFLGIELNFTINTRQRTILVVISIYFKN
jgi:hypothetical protein